MKRSGFLKSLATIIAAPSLLKDVGVSPPFAHPVIGTITPAMEAIADLKLLTPNWHKELVEKYSYKNYQNYVTQIREDWGATDIEKLQLENN